MKKFIAALSLATISFGAFAQEGKVVGGSGPQISVDKDTHDYGTIDKGANGTCEFKVTNTGDQPQQTNDYDTLSLTYTTGGASGFDGEALPATTIAPGASQTFDVDLPIKLVGGTAHCFVGIGFPPADSNFTTPHVGVTSNSVDLTVVPAETTTSGP